MRQRRPLRGARLMAAVVVHQPIDHRRPVASSVWCDGTHVLQRDSSTTDDSHARVVQQIEAPANSIRRGSLADRTHHVEDDLRPRLDQARSCRFNDEVAVVTAPQQRQRLVPRRVGGTDGPVHLPDQCVDQGQRDRLWQPDPPERGQRPRPGEPITCRHHPRAVGVPEYCADIVGELGEFPDRGNPAVRVLVCWCLVGKRSAGDIDGRPQRPDRQTQDALVGIDQCTVAQPGGLQTVHARGVAANSRSEVPKVAGTGK